MVVEKQASVSVPRVLLDNTVRFVECSSLLAKKALDECETHRTAQKRAADLRPGILNHLLTLGVVGESHKEACDAMLGSHAETLNLLKIAADKIDKLTKEAQPQKKASDGPGKAEDDPVASNRRGNEKVANSLEDPRVGGNYQYLKESDRVLLRQIGK